MRLFVAAAAALHDNYDAAAAAAAAALTGVVQKQQVDQDLGLEKRDRTLPTHPRLAR